MAGWVDLSRVCQGLLILIFELQAYDWALALSLYNFKALVRWVGEDSLSFLSHKVFYVCSAVSEPAKVICYQVQRITATAADKDNTFGVGVFAESSSLFGSTLCASISH